MNKYQEIVDGVINNADIILFILDARAVEQTRNLQLEETVKKLGKPLIYVITKSDLIDDKAKVEKYKKTLKPCVFISSTKYYGITILKEKIMIESKRIGITDLIKVGTIGFPNVGKSSLINAMSGKGSASTSIISGHTKGVQEIRASKTIIFLDTPGVIPPEDKDQSKHAMVGSIDFTKTKNPDLDVMRVMEEFPGVIEKYYDVEISDNFEETIEKIAIKKKMVMKGNKPDIDKASRAILKNWQTGRIK
jgi:ribosome biogenesis GTPase A